MIVKFGICFVLLLTVSLSTQWKEYTLDPVRNNPNLHNEVVEFDPVSEFSQLRGSIARISNSINNVSDKLSKKLIDMFIYVQSNVDKVLDRFAWSVKNLFGVEPDDYYDDVAETTTAASKYFSGKTLQDVGKFFAIKIKNVQVKIHNKIDSIIKGIKNMVVNFKKAVRGHSADLSCKVRIFERSYPGINTPECSKMIVNFKTTIVHLLEDAINCVKDRLLFGTQAADQIDDLAVDSIKERVNDMKTAWNCAVETEGTYTYKFVKCVDFGSVKAVYTLLNSLTKKVDDNFGSILDSAEKTVTVASCMNRKVRSSYETQLISLVQSTMTCSSNVKSTKPDFSACPREDYY